MFFSVIKMNIVIIIFIEHGIMLLVLLSVCLSVCLSVHPHFCESSPVYVDIIMALCMDNLTYIYQTWTTQYIIKDHTN